MSERLLLREQAWGLEPCEESGVCRNRDAGVDPETERGELKFK